jgi:hypothetical protein
MRNKIPLLSGLAAALMLLTACNLDSANEALNVFSVKFSEGSPPADGQTVAYSGGVFETPSLDKFHFRIVFHVKADNSKNTYKAGFGSDAVKPVVNFRINSKSAAPISAPIPPFSVEAGQVGDLEFPIDIPLSLIDKTVAKKIINGDAIPYFLSGAVKFQLLEGITSKGTGSSELELTSGEVATRPSGPVVSLLSGLL